MTATVGDGPGSAVKPALGRGVREDAGAACDPAGSGAGAITRARFGGVLLAGRSFRPDELRGVDRGATLGATGSSA